MYEIVLAPLAALMVIFVAATVKWAFRAKERIGYSFVLFVLTMMASMFASAVIYFTAPDLQSIEIDAALNSTVMLLGLTAIIYSFVTHRGAGHPVVQRGLMPGSPVLFRASVIVLILLNEFLMGWSFSLISGIPKISYYGTGSFSGVANLALNSYWFTFTMASEMLLTLFFFRERLPRELQFVLTIQALVMFLSPPAAAIWGLSVPSIYAGSALMVVFFIFVFDYLYKNRNPRTVISNYLLLLTAVYALMMASLFYWGIGGDPIFFGFTLLAEMIVYFDAILRSNSFSEGRRMQWQERGMWTFSLLLLLFVSEYFMAATMDAAYYGKDYFIFGAAPLAGSAATVAAASVYDFIRYVAVVTASPWFYIMMGAEMGYLVAMQIRKVKQAETKVRLAMVIAAYVAFYFLLLPHFILPGLNLSEKPFLGWNMGIGTGGSFSPVFLAAIAGTYLISGTLSFLFGGRQMCSMFCSAALMYQGTFYDAAKSFNRKSAVAKLTHRNNSGKLFAATASVVWASIIVSAVLSYLDSVGAFHVSIFGEDPVVFMYILYFDFLWYAIFISLPFLGSYACVTTGMCHWGMFNQLVGRIGIFRLKVKDRYECVNCKTKDCAAACPVGLTAMPGSFIGSGEFRNYKCIGVGQCASACPVDNIFFYDARDWFRERFRRSRPNLIQDAVLSVPEERGRK